MNRSDRRRAAKDAGVPWRDHRAAERAEAVALRLSPDQAREALARWAAQPGRSQADVDALNGRMSLDDVRQNGGDTGYSAEFFESVVGSPNVRD